MDFVHDPLATGKKLRILAVVDTHSRYCPAADVRFTYRGEHVVQTLEGICRKTGYPKTIRVDNGSGGSGQGSARTTELVPVIRFSYQRSLDQIINVADWPLVNFSTEPMS
ncbi:hypothetical protein thsrh120_52680 [Rhizobium sp. No.120]